MFRRNNSRIAHRVESNAHEASAVAAAAAAGYEGSPKLKKSSSLSGSRRKGVVAGSRLYIPRIRARLCALLSHVDKVKRSCGRLFLYHHHHHTHMPARANPATPAPAQQTSARPSACSPDRVAECIEFLKSSATSLPLNALNNNDGINAATSLPHKALNNNDDDDDDDDDDDNYNNDNHNSIIINVYNISLNKMAQ